MNCTYELNLRSVNWTAKK